MFKGITRSIGVKKHYYRHLEESEEKIRKAIRVYVASVFDDCIDFRDIKYSVDTKKSTITVVASSKTIANDIKLSLGELAKALRGEGLLIKTIIIQ